MERSTIENTGLVARWPRLLGLILLLAAAQAALGAWIVGGRTVAAYLAGCAATAGVLAVLLLAVPLRHRPSRESSQGPEPVCREPESF